MLQKNHLSNDWVDTLIALSNLVITELSPDLYTDTENMSICKYVMVYCFKLSLQSLEFTLS